MLWKYRAKSLLHKFGVNVNIQCQKFNWNQSNFNFSQAANLRKTLANGERHSNFCYFLKEKKSCHSFDRGSNMDNDLTFATKPRETKAGNPTGAGWIRKLKSSAAAAADGCRCRAQCCQFGFRLVLNMSTLLCYGATCARKWKSIE